jgi:hypothetical protein
VNVHDRKAGSILCGHQPSHLCAEMVCAFWLFYGEKIRSGGPQKFGWVVVEITQAEIRWSKNHLPTDEV